MPDAAAPSFPPAVLDHVYGEPLEAWYQKFTDEQKLLGVERDALDEAAWKVYTRASTLDKFFQELEEIFGSPERAKAIGIPILGNDFLKIEDYLGIDIPAYIKHLGGDPSLFVKEIPVMEVVRGVLAGIGAGPADPVIAKRLETSVTAYLSGIRDALETKDVLMRSVKVGGIGLDAATADRITSALEEKLRALQHAGVILRKGDGKPPEQSTFHLVKPAKSGLMQREDEEEIDRLRASAPVDTMREQLRTAVDRVVQKTGAKFKSDDVSRRFRGAIEARLRDIRDYQETLDLLTRPSTAGGFGIATEQAKKVLSVVEEEVRALHGKPTAPSPDARVGAGRQPQASAPPPQSTSPSPAPTTAITPQLVHPVPLRSPPPASVAEAFRPPPDRGDLEVAATPTSPPAPPKLPPAVVPAAQAKPVPPSPPPEIATSLLSVAPRNDIQSAAPSPSLPRTPPTPSVAETIRPPRGDLKVAATRPPPVPPPPLEPPRKIAITQPILPPKPPTPPPPKPQADSLQPQAPSPAIPVPPSPPVAPPPDVKRIPIVPAPRPISPLGARGATGELPPDRNTSPPPLAPRGGAAAGTSSRPKLQDIRPMPARLVGPIEELAQLTLSDFRKIAKTPAEAAARIAEKLALLEKDSYTKRSEGVKVLRGSPLMGTYADVVNAALIAKRTIEVEVRERLTKDRAAITREEVQALMGLNQQLRF